MSLKVMKVLRYFVVDPDSEARYEYYSIKSEYCADHNGEQDVIAIIVLNGSFYRIVNKNEDEFNVSRQDIEDLNIYRYERVNPL